jgi:predicted pyridoxine 5'-phosphate oxidase superfamily flavin-nucleotide-binding protein
MQRTMLIDDIRSFLGSKIFLMVGTSNEKGVPNVAPKVLLKFDEKAIYLADYVFGRTWQNIKVNPFVSLATVNFDTLVGYQINGSVEIIEAGKVYEQLCKEYENRQVKLSVRRVVEGVHREREHNSFELGLSQDIVIFKVNVSEVVAIERSGAVKRTKAE